MEAFEILGYLNRKVSKTGFLAIAFGGWLILNSAASQKPVTFFGSMNNVWAIQLIALGGIAQHTKGLPKKED